ncbi:TetR/AcrR family transcriptional regulator [Nocardioides salsibiostraticola]
MVEENERKRRYARRLPPAERREQLLDAALTVLIREGYRHVSVEAIAREAGVTRPVVYATFDGLEPLLHALLDRTQRRALESAVGLLAREPDTSERDTSPAGDFEAWLIQRLADFLDLVRREPEVWQPVLGLVGGTPPLVTDRIERTRAFLRGEMAQRLTEGLGADSTQVDTEVLAELLLVNVEHLGRLTLDQPDHFTRERLVAAVSPLLLRRTGSPNI